MIVDVNKSFLEIYVPKWMVGLRFNGSAIVQYKASPHKARVITDYLMENKFDTWGHTLIHMMYIHVISHVLILVRLGYLRLYILIEIR